MSTTKQLFNAAVATDLMTFFERAFRDVENRSELINADYLELLVENLTNVAAGKETRLAINVCPRSLKSILVSIVFPAWLFGRDPRLKIAVISHSQMLARDLALKSRRISEADWYREAFPGTRLREDRNQAMDFETTEGGGRYAGSFDTGVTGRGFDIIIVDDPISAHHAKSAAERQRVKDAYDSMLASRLDPTGKKVIILVGQRLHEDDLFGYLLSKGGWNHIRLPLLAEGKTTYRIGSRLWVREPGDPLVPKLWPPEVIAQVRSGEGEAIFSAQYQQNPSAAIGELIQPGHIRTFEELPPSANRITLSWDTAVKTGSNASYTVCLVIARDDNRHYVIDVLRERLDSVQMREAALRLLGHYSNASCLIEDASSGPGLARMLQEKGHHRGCMLWPTGGQTKEERIVKHLHMFVEGRILVWKGQPWTVELVNEWVRFPFAKHDDQVDAMSQYLDWIALTAPRAKPVIALAGGSEEKLVRALSNRTLPVRKGENPLRPRSGGFRIR